MVALRRLWGKPEATAAELDQHAAELLANAEGGPDAENAEEEPTAGPDDHGDDADSEAVASLRQQVSNQQALIGTLQESLATANRTIEALTARLDALEALAPQTASYETQGAEGNADAPWMCETTRRAMKANGR